MSDQIDFDDNEYVWPVGDTPDLDTTRLAPALPPIPTTVIVNDGTWETMWNGFQRLSTLLDAARGASIFDRAADEIEALRKDNAELADILAVAMNTPLTL